MALIACRECTREISSEALACPHCGAQRMIGTAAPCRNCARPVPPGATVCPNCGAVGPVRGYPGAAPGVLVRAPKSRGLFIILGLFLGCLGVHNFYAGYYTKGAIQVAITVVLGWMIVGLVITALWALLEIITVTADADGQRMS
jgi:TM2 domain-containing membrane protein YozV/RNA polymerase subunit RPABC4/transcription elongation factor Spt4